MVANLQEEIRRLHGSTAEQSGRRNSHVLSMLPKEFRKLFANLSCRAPRYSSALLLIAACVGLAADSKAPCGGTAQIDEFAARTDAQLKRMRVRTFAASDSLHGEEWSELTDSSETEGTAASVYFDQGTPVAAFFTIQTESGDWVLFACYYFRSDGSLAKRHERLNTSYGSASVLRDAYFGCHGEAYGGLTRHLDLKTQKPKKPDPEFVDERAPLFKRVQDLPFFSLLKPRG
jgi:hypothetical protein